ncbi:unnamed protein product [Prorocentrum cordatum]|uniref:Uncharacterized protein n=1 Tax=Prorocentrum cordatum TaxID=2364126 RepID=A0ABN9SIY0_9DINO|nr:unnamed protein product [Polarella glacialis]
MTPPSSLVLSLGGCCSQPLFAGPPEVVLSEIVRSARIAVDATANATAAVSVTSSGHVDGLAFSRECEESLMQLLAGPSTPCGFEKLHAVMLFGGLCLTLVRRRARPVGITPSSWPAALPWRW